MLPSMSYVRLIVQQIKDRTVLAKSRRSLFLIILGATLIFYILSRWVSRPRVHHDIQFNPCLHARLEEYAIDQSYMDAIVNHQPIQYGELVSLPFTGNGHLALSFTSQADIQLIPDTNSSFLSSGYSPLLEISSKRSDESRATVLHMKEGFLRRFHCIPMNDRRLAHVSHRLYVHRRRPSLIVQDIELVNPSDESLELTFRTKRANQQEIKLDSQKETFLLTADRISLRDHRSIVFVVLTSQLRLDSPLKPQSQSDQTILTVVKASPILSDAALLNSTYLKHWQKTLQNEAKEDLLDALSISSSRLFDEHRQTWRSIWQSGFSISRSFAPSTMNGDRINRTIYYVLCATPAPLHEQKIDDLKRKELDQSLFRIDRCYESHSTLLGERLWRDAGDVLAVSQLATLWQSTLTKKGCSTLMLSGVDGVLQAILLSIGGIRFRNHHLEMFLDPKELHREMFFRSIHFGEQASLNITLTIEHDNRAVINVSIEHDRGQAYACDAGCIDEPTKLKREPVRFPVKMTDPPTAILYITEDAEYMKQLKDTLHVKEVQIAPPHAHDLLALHRHGHKLGGLPVIFWIVLAFLIVIFHLFLLKIVLNEMGFVKTTFPISTSSSGIRARAH